MKFLSAKNSLELFFVKKKANKIAVHKNLLINPFQISKEMKEKAQNDISKWSNFSWPLITNFLNA